MPTISSTSSGANCNNTATLSLSANAGCSYQWSNGATGNSITVTKGQVYRVNQITDEGCVRTDSKRPTFNYGCDNADLNLCLSSIYPAGYSLQTSSYSSVSIQADYTLPTSTPIYT